jgi:hypothetical protein
LWQARRLPRVAQAQAEEVQEVHQVRPRAAAEATLVVAVAAATLAAAAVAVAAAIWAEVATARGAAWAVTLQQTVRAVPHWQVTAPLWRIMAPHMRTPCMPTTRFRANMPRVSIPHQGSPALSIPITITTRFAASP